MHRVKRDASNSPLQSFRRVVFPVADDRVTDCRKLHPNLILQPRHQRNSEERGGAKTAFDEIPKFGTSRLGGARCGQPLKHSLSPEVVNQRPFFDAEMTANNCEIGPNRSVAEKLLNQCVPIRLGFCKEHDPGRKTIDAMYNKRSLSTPTEFGRKQRPCGRRIGALHRHSRQPGRFVKGHHGIVLVEHD